MHGVTPNAVSHACRPHRISSLGRQRRHQGEIARDPTLSMASIRLVWLVAAAAMAAAAFVPAPASAEDHLVGGLTGWNLSYPVGWPEGRTFKVGDSLVFDYLKGTETVTEVDSEAFRDCYRQGNRINEWASGHDAVRLVGPGRRWFFSSVDNHCDLGLKLVVDVVGSVAPAPATVAPAPAPVSPTPQPRPTPTPAPSPVAIPPDTPPPSPSSAALNYYKIDEAVARAAVVAGAIIAAVFV